MRGIAPRCAARRWCGYAAPSSAGAAWSRYRRRGSARWALCWRWVVPLAADHCRERIQRGVDVGLAHPAQVADADDAPAQRALSAGENGAVLLPRLAQEPGGVDAVRHAHRRHARREVIRVGKEL